MTQHTEKKILLAMDQSEYAFEAVKYLSRISSLRKKRLVLFTVFSPIRDSYWDLEKEPVYAGKLGEISAWEALRKKALKEHMSKAKQVLLGAGFSDTSVEIKLHQRKEGIARDILSEAGQGYESLVIGRRGVSRVRGIVLGSVAAKLLQKNIPIPLLMVGRNARPGKILIALDGSSSSMKAVDYAGEMFGEAGYDIRLTNVVRDEESNRIAEAEKRIAAVFNEATARLANSGISLNQINSQIITGARSRAEAIIKEADQGGYGTIVVGKRGLSEVRDFFMGSVSYKVVQLARGRAVLVVS